MPSCSHRTKVSVRLILAAVALALSIAACAGTTTVTAGGDTEPETPADGGSGRSSIEGIPLPDFAVFAKTADEYCNKTGDSRIEMAFLGEVRTIVDAAPSPVDEETETNPNPAPQPWATFDVQEFFTEDIGTEVALWAPEFEGQPGETWLIAASRYAVGDLPSGEVYWCASEPSSEAAVAEWSERYGGSVEPGVNRGEHEPPPELLAQIDDAEALWQRSAPLDYTATIYTEPGDGEGECPLHVARIVVVGGELVEAVNPSPNRFCEIPLDKAPTIESLFDIARAGAGAGEYGLETDSEYGFVRSVEAYDRSINMFAGVSDFTTEAIPYNDAGSGRDDQRAALAENRALWEASGINNYTIAIEYLCFCYAPEVTVEVADGAIVSIVTEDGSDPAQSVPDMARTVDELFTLAESAIADADHVLLAYHPDFGYPVDINIDYHSGAIDDELRVVVESFAPMD